MAQKTVVELLDDIDGRPADETIVFSMDGVTYEIDLNTTNATRLRESFAPYIDKARKAGGAARAARKDRSAGPRSAGTRERSAEIRAWAKQHGITVNERGRIPANILEAFESDDPARAKAEPAKVPQTVFRAVSNP